MIGVRGVEYGWGKQIVDDLECVSVKNINTLVRHWL